MNSLGNSLGFDANFVEPLQENHQCPVCLLALRDPLQTVCGHRICSGCYAKMREDCGDSGYIQCPVDQSMVHKEDMFPDIYAKREILGLETYCRYRDSGCQWKDVLRQFEEHIVGCEYQAIECPNGCEIMLPQHLVAKHLEETCPYRRAQCEFCNKVFKHVELSGHYDGCEYYPIDCPYNCGEIKIPQRLLQDHIENYCKLAEGACTFSFCGCTFKGSRAELQGHLEKETEEHLLKAAKHAVSMETQNTELRRKLEQETNRVEVLEQKLDEGGRELLATQQQLLKIQEKMGTLETEFSKMKVQGTKIEEILKNLEKKSGPSTSPEIENLKLQSQQLQRTVETMAARVTEKTGLSERQSGPMSLPSSSMKGSAELERRAERIENQLALQDVQMAELDLKLQLLEATSYDGVLIWKIDNYKRRKHDAVTGKTPSLYSPPFYTSRFGYKMCARIYLNGDGQGKGSHISMFFVVMRSEYDALLPWPFPCKITMQLMAQEGNDVIIETFRPDPNSSSFRRPASDMNIASGCPLFVSQTKLAGAPYMVKDSIFVKVIVSDSSDQPNLS